MTARGYFAGGTSKSQPQTDDSRDVEVEHGAMLRASALDSFLSGRALPAWITGLGLAFIAANVSPDRAR